MNLSQSKHKIPMLLGLLLFFQGWVLNRLMAHIFIGFLFGYLYRGVGREANRILANYVYLYGTLLLTVYTGKMPVTLCCKYQTYFIPY